MYAGMLLISTFVACLMLTPGIQTKLANSSWFCKGLSGIAGLNCSHAVGFQAVYSNGYFLLHAYDFDVGREIVPRRTIENTKRFLVLQICVCHCDYYRIILCQ
ncbi:unnamed protein product, partial [Onchocerca ochengi]|uniref:Secreted protein n=1 Tax=Onchocerca ochengi TaxID=42157 RepID=A0A182EZ99_ONCOC